MRQVETSSLHHGVAGARHTFVPLPPAANKLDLLLQVGRAVGRCGALPCAWQAQRARALGWVAVANVLVVAVAAVSAWRVASTRERM